MKKIQISTNVRKKLADLQTSVSIYLKIRDEFPNAILLESSDYRGNENSYSFICFEEIGLFQCDRGNVIEKYPGQPERTGFEKEGKQVLEKMNQFLTGFDLKSTNNPTNINGFFGYFSFDSIPYFEKITFENTTDTAFHIPEIRFGLYRFIIIVNHFKNELYIVENCLDGETSNIDRVESILTNRTFANYRFTPEGTENSNITDKEYMEMVAQGKKSCYRGDVFQIVLSRQFSQSFKGDEFNVYRALRSINPSPYLFYFDFGSYKLFGSSPESEIIVKSGKAYISPIAGTFKRTGNDEQDKELAQKLSKDKKEAAEHVMLVDLARNDLSRSCSNVTVETFSEVQFYSHVIHLVSKVSGKLLPESNPLKIIVDTFPAGTLSGAPKHKAMQLIDKFENQSRSFYGGCLGYIGFNGDVNQAIMIRSFLSKNNTLYYQAGAGIVSESVEQNELQEVNNKLGALKKAIVEAQNL
jgi:anthranilate synthase component I